MDRDRQASRQARALWQELRRYRRSHHQSTISDRYVGVFGLIVGTAMVWGAGSSFSFPLVECTGVSCAGLTWAAPLLLFCLIGVTAAASALLGPIAVSQAESFWMLSGPLPRRFLLRRFLYRLAAIGVVIGVTTWLMGFGIFGQSPWWLMPFILGSVSTVLAFVVMQTMGSADTERALGGILAGLVPVVLIGCFVAARGTAFPDAGWWFIVFCCAIALGWAGIAADQALSRLRARFLANQAGLRLSLAGATVSGDSALAFEILTTRLLARMPEFRLPGTGTGLRAIAAFELQRTLLRSPQVFLGMLFPLTVTAVCQALGIPGLGTLLSTIGMVPSSALLLTGLRTGVRSAGMGRCFPFRPSHLCWAFSATGLGVCLGWAIIAGGVLVLTGAPWTTAWASSLTMAAAGAAGAIRWTLGRPPDFSTGYVMSEMGPLPVTGVAMLLQGPDLAALLVVPLVLGIHPWLAVLLALAGLARTVQHHPSPK